MTIKKTDDLLAIREKELSDCKNNAQEQEAYLHKSNQEFSELESSIRRNLTNNLDNNFLNQMYESQLLIIKKRNSIAEDTEKELRHKLHAEIESISEDIHTLIVTLDKVKDLDK